MSSCITLHNFSIKKRGILKHSQSLIHLKCRQERQKGCSSHHFRSNNIPGLLYSSFRGERQHFLTSEKNVSFVCNPPPPPGVLTQCITAILWFKNSYNPNETLQCAPGTAPGRGTWTPRGTWGIITRSGYLEEGMYGYGFALNTVTVAMI